MSEKEIKEKRISLKREIIHLLLLTSIIPIILIVGVNAYFLNRNIINVNNSVINGNISLIKEALSIDHKNTEKNLAFLASDANARRY